MYEFRTRCSLADHCLFFLPVTSTTNLRQQARTPPPRRKAKEWAKTNQERGLSICYCSCRHSALVGWAAPRRVYLQWKSLHQVCTSYATSLHRKLMLVYTQTEIVQTSLHTVYTWKATKLKQVYTKFAKPRQKFTLSLQSRDKSLHKVWKNRKKFTLSLKNREKVYTKFEKTRKKFTQSLKSAKKVYTKFE